MRENSPSIFRVIGSDIRSIEMHSTPKKIKKSREVEQVAELTKSIVKKNKFIYIDMQDKTGVKVMEQARRSSDCDSDEDTENLGDLCITNLKNLSRGSQHMYRYLDNIKSHKHRKEHIESILGGRKTEKVTLPLYAKNPNQMTSQKEITQFLEHQKSICLKERLQQGEIELSKKVSILGQLTPTNSKVVGTASTARQTVDKDQQQMEKLNQLFNNMKMLTMPRKKFSVPVNLPSLTNKSFSLQLRKNKKKLNFN